MTSATFPTPPLTHAPAAPLAGKLGAEQQIHNLVYSYAELMDAARLEECAELFSRAVFKLGAHEVDHRTMLTNWQGLVIVQPDGTLGTSHITSNVLIEFGEDGRTATCRSRFTVMQATETLPLQAVASGRYFDTFAVDEAGDWYFTSRSYAMPLVGDMSQHTRPRS